LSNTHPEGDCFAYC